MCSRFAVACDVSFLTNLGFSVLNIRTVHILSERENLVKQFNNANDSGLGIGICFFDVLFLGETSDVVRYEYGISTEEVHRYSGSGSV